MSTLHLKILRTLFWICWPGPLLFTVYLLFLEHSDINIAPGSLSERVLSYILVVLPLLMTGLCFVSAVIVCHAPKLARFGIVSMGMPILAPLAKAAIVQHF